jgi:hypothetical protein
MNKPQRHKLSLGTQSNDLQISSHSLSALSGWSTGGLKEASATTTNDNI